MRLRGDDQLFVCSILVMLTMFVLIRSLNESDSQMQRDKTASERACHFTFSEPTATCHCRRTRNDLLQSRKQSSTVRVGWVICSVPEYVIKNLKMFITLT